jgi:tRNA threonylcarbamoyladenosine biosynthesis protein TsaE
VSLDDLLPTETSSADDTIALGERFADILQSGDIVALYGDLGAGKTHLVKGIACGLGLDPASVSSPTFTLINEYDGTLPLYHLDLYRIESLDEAERLGLDDYLHGKGLCVIEWPERIESLLPSHTIRLGLTHLGSDQRRIEIKRSESV